jgi:hypothetical protein
VRVEAEQRGRGGDQVFGAAQAQFLHVRHAARRRRPSGARNDRFCGEGRGQTRAVDRNRAGIVGAGR